MLRRFAICLFCLAAPAAAEPFAGPWVAVVSGLDRTDVGPRLGAENGLLYGIGAGYDWRFGRVSAGPDLEWNDATTRRAGIGSSNRVGRSLYAGVRAGVTVADRLQLFARAGYANGRFLPAAGSVYSGDGFRIGGGAEYAVSDRWFLRGEYRYSDYGREARGQTFAAVAGARF